MSTKTTFKRVALVAVAALGLGVLTSVAPATAAADAAITSLTAGTPSPVRVGVTSTVTITAAHAADATNNTFKVAAKVATAPSTSKTKTDTNTASLGVTMVTGTGTGESLSQANAYVVGGANAVVGSTEDLATSSTFKVSFRADVEGTYTVLVSAGNTAYTAGDKTVVVTFTTVGAPTALTVASLGGSVVTGGKTNGQLFGLTMKDANGNATVLGQDESIVLSESDAAVDLLTFGGSALTAFGAGTDAAGTYIFRAVESSAGTAATGTTVITLTGSGLLPSSLVTNTTATKVTAGAWSAHTGVDAVADVACKAASTVCVAGSNFSVNGAATVTVSGFASAGVAAATKYIVKVTTAAATPLTYDTTITLGATATTDAAATVTASFTAPAPTASYDSSIALGATPFTVTFQYGKPAAKAIATTNTTSVLSALAGTSTFGAKVTDQYGNAVANEAVTIKVSGRNTVAEKALALTDANGLVSYTHTDAGTTGTVDTVTFGAAGATTTKTAAYTINYGTVTVGTVTVTGGSTVADAGVAGTTKTTIKAGDNGPEGSAVDVKAVVKDANGNLLAGVPVTFTVDKGAIVKSASVDYAVVYTGSDGSATTKAFNWVPSTQTITATAGGKSSTDYLTWVADDASSARVLSATATGDIVSVKVVDRFGNGVKGVTVNLSRTGTGLFGNGSSTQDVKTDKNGTSDVRFSGSGTVVAELDTATYAQAADIAGQIGAIAVTAAVAGTTKGTGASLAPAGVSKVSVAIAEGDNTTLAAATAAVDAAAEATDAANAATDAANAAAEAADAATAAAQDAADAVAALSTQVSEMIDALKKQITALTNLVIKIQKKVKA